MFTVYGSASVGRGYEQYSAPTDGMIVKGKVGIATTSPSNILELSGNAYFNGNLAVTGALTVSGSAIYGAGGQILASDSGVSRNYFFGGAGNVTMTGTNNTGFGIYALRDNTTGGNNTAMGGQALQYNTIGKNNIAIGESALAWNKTGSSSVAIGFSAGAVDGDTNESTTQDFGMTFVGYHSSRDGAVPTTTSLYYASAIGYNAKVGCSNCLALGGSGTYAAHVGIGTSTPSAVNALEVSGNGYFSGNLTAANITATGTLSLGNLNSTFLAVDQSGHVVATSTSGFTQWQSAVPGLHYDANAVGIGESAPLARLHVGGTYLSSITGFVGEQTVGDGYTSNAGTTNTVVGKVYPYVNWNGHHFYSKDHAEYTLNFTCEGPGDCGTFDTYWNWDDVAGADGYRLVLTRNANSDVYVDLAVSEYTDDGNAGTAGSTPTNTANDTGLIVDGGVIIGYGLRGVSVPVNGLTVEGGATFSHDNTGSPSTVSIDGSLCVFSDRVYCGSTAGTIYADDTTIRHADLAEDYPTRDATVSAGDIVALSDETTVINASSTVATSSPEKIALIEKAGPDNKHRAIGIVSTKPGVRFGYGAVEGLRSEPVALAGRVPTKVSTENGPVKIGDRIALSSVPGVGMKAGRSGLIVGVALENYDGTGGQTMMLTQVSTSTESASGTVTSREVKISPISVLVSLRYAELSPVIENGEVSIAEETRWSVSEDGSIRSMSALDLSAFDIKNIRALRSASGLWSLTEDGVLSVKEIRSEKLCLGTTCITENELKMILQTANVSASSAGTSTGNSAALSGQSPSDNTSTTSPAATSTESQMATSSPALESPPAQVSPATAADQPPTDKVTVPAPAAALPPAEPAVELLPAN
jgi:hypothetical protein